MKKCTKCHIENPNSANYCMNCGSKLDNDELRVEFIEPYTIYFEASERIKETNWIRKNSIFHEFENGKGSIRLKNSVIEIGEDAFYGCGWLTAIIIPDTIKAIKKNAFMNCQNLATVIIPNSVEEIGESAFQDCENLTKIVIPDSLTKVGENIFKGCRMLPQSVVQTFQERCSM